MMVGRRRSSVPAPPADHSQQFCDFLASELAALQERLVAKFEQGEPISTRASRTLRRVSVVSSVSKETTSCAGGRFSEVSEGERRRASLVRRRKSDDEVSQTLPAWDRMVVKLLAAEDPTQYSVADLAVRIAGYAESPQDQSRSSRLSTTSLEEEEAIQRPTPHRRSSTLTQEEAMQEDIITPHTVWISQGVVGQSGYRPSSKGRRSTFALSCVAEPGVQMDSSADLGRYGRRSVSDWIAIHPDSVFRYLWCLIGAVFLMYDLFAIPMEAVGLWSEGSSNDFILASIAYWCADLIVQSLTGYHTQNLVEMKPFKTFSRYASTWMPLDLVVLLIDVAFVVFKLNSTARSLRILKLLRLARLARLHKWVLAFQSLMKHNTSELVDMSVKIGRIMFVLVCHCHFTACAWYGIAEEFEDPERRPGERNWVEASGLSGESQFMRYAVALHWSVTQFTPATNDVVPINGAERVFAIVVVLLGFVTFSGFLSTMMRTLSQLNFIKQSQERERKQLLQFFRTKQIPAGLADRVLRLFNAECKLKRDHLVEDDLAIFSSLPLSLRLRIRREYCLPRLETHRVLGGVYHLDPRCFLQVIHEAMTDMRCNAQQEVFVDGIESHHTYAVSSGKLKYYQSGAPAALVSSGWVSEASLYVQWVHQGSLVAKSSSELLVLDCQGFRQIMLQTGGDLFRVLCCCAVLFAHKLEASVEANSELTDLGLSRDEQDEILRRALRLCKVHCRPEGAVIEHDDERAIAPRTRWKKLQKSLRMSRDIESEDEDEVY